MARRTSKGVNHVPKPLAQSAGALGRRWVSLSDVVSKLLELEPTRIKVEPEFTSDAVWAGLIGRACERVRRERGGTANVAPLLDLPRGLKAWLGFRETWDNGGRRYVFRYTALTVHIGFEGDPVKPQVFRSEWTGIREWPGTGFGFQSPRAGHPHWQFDLNETLRSFQRESPILGLDDNSEEVLEEFGTPEPEQDIWDLLGRTTFERMHFASGAQWWSEDDNYGYRSHMNAPSSEAELTRWLRGCILYLKQELTRCEVVS